MSISNYIHYQYNNWSKKNSPEDNTNYLMGIYSNNKIKQRYKESTTELNEKLKKIYLSKINSISSNKMGEKEFFNLLKDIQENALEKAAEKMTQKLQTTDISMLDIVKTTGIEKDVSNLQNIFNKFKDILEQITGGTFSKNPIPILTKDMLKGDMSVDNIKKVYRDAYLSDRFTFKVDSTYTRAISSHANEINKMLASMSALENIKNGGMNSFPLGTQNETINAFIWSIYTTINRIVGFVSEDVLKDFLPEILKENVFKDLPADVIVKTEGTKGTDVFSVKTEDISISLNMNNINYNKEAGNIQISLPGVSLKRTNLKNNNTLAKIQVKSTKLGTLLNNIELNGNIWDFYNAYSDYNMAIKQLNKSRALPAQLNKGANLAMKNMYNYYHAAMLPLAVSGSLTSDDFAYFLVVNDKVYNVIEIIQKVANNDDFSSIESNLSTHQNNIKNIHQRSFIPERDPHSNIEGYERSSYMINTINKLNIVMKLILEVNKIK